MVDVLNYQLVFQYLILSTNITWKMGVCCVRSLVSVRLQDIISIPDHSENRTESGSDKIIVVTTNPEERYLYRFSQFLLQCKPLTLGFAQENQSWDEICCMCSKSMEGWMKAYNCSININDLERCLNINFTPRTCMDYVNRKLCSSYHHYLIQQYWIKLYCIDEGFVGPCIANPEPRPLYISTIISWCVNGNFDHPATTLVSSTLSAGSSSSNNNSSNEFPKTIVLPELKYIDIEKNTLRYAENTIMSYNSWYFSRSCNYIRWTYIRKKNTLPLTHEELKSKELANNIKLRQIIQSCYNKEPIVSAQDSKLVAKPTEDTKPIVNHIEDYKPSKISTRKFASKCYTSSWNISIASG